MLVAFLFHEIEENHAVKLTKTIPTESKLQDTTVGSVDRI